MHKLLHVKYLLFLSGFNDTRIFSTDFLKNNEILNSMKIRPVEAELFHADGRTDKRTEDRQTSRQAGRQVGRHEDSNSRFSQFCKRA